MLKRTITALILIGSVVGVMAGTYFVSRVFVDVMVLVYVAGAMYEMYHCLKNVGYKMFAVPLTLAVVAVYPAYLVMQKVLGATHGENVGMLGILLVFLSALIITLIIFTFRPAKKRPQDITAEDVADLDRAVSINDLFANVFVLAYPLLFMSLAWGLTNKYYAIFALTFAIFLPVGGDTFAYWFGSMIGGKKLCPKISPKKTIAGAIGGLVGSMAVAIIFWAVFEYLGVLSSAPNGQVYVQFISHNVDGWAWRTAIIYLVIGLAGGVLAQLGDLAASKIKRAIGVKDYGNIFPGHGGVMDRLDSITFDLVVLSIAFACIYGF